MINSIKDLKQQYQERIEEVKSGNTSNIKINEFVRFTKNNSKHDYIEGKQTTFGIQDVEDLDPEYIINSIKLRISFLNLLINLKHLSAENFIDWYIDQIKNIAPVHGSESGIIYKGIPVPKERYYPYLNYLSKYISKYDKGLDQFLINTAQEYYFLNVEELNDYEKPILMREISSNCNLTILPSGERQYDWLKNCTYHDIPKILTFKYVSPNGRIKTANVALNHLKQLVLNIEKNNQTLAINNLASYYQRMLWAHILKNGNNLQLMQHIVVIFDLLKLEMDEPHGLLDFLAIYSQPETFPTLFQEYFNLRRLND